MGSGARTSKSAAVWEEHASGCRGQERRGHGRCAAGSLPLPMIRGLFRLSAFDRTVALVIAGFAAIIGFTVVRGDQVGVQVTRSTPEGRAGRGSVVAIQFSEAMRRESVAERLTLEPAVPGTMSWSGSR